MEHNQQAMELLFQQCVNDARTVSNNGEHKTNLVVDSVDAAPILDFLAQACEEANDTIQEMSYEDVAMSLAQAVQSTQESLRGVQQSVQEFLENPEKMHELCQQIDSTDKQLRLMEQERIDSSMHSFKGPNESTLQLNTSRQELAVTSSNEENVRGMMVFAENMCSVLDNALGTITKDEYELAAQLGLNIAQKVMEVGQSLFESLGDEERRTTMSHQRNRSDHITIEELDEEETNTAIANASQTAVPLRMTAAERRRQKRQQKMQVAVIRTYMEGVLKRVQDGASQHPFAAVGLSAVLLPFIGFAIPIASIVGLALALENYYPEHTSVTLEMVSNFMRMMKLWLLLLKITARQCGLVAKACISSWYEYASKHGFIATGVELTSTCCTIGWFGVTRLYQGVMQYATKTS